MSRGQWPNRFIFILAAVGSAAGIGNLWRFPTWLMNTAALHLSLPWLLQTFLLVSLCSQQKWGSVRCSKRRHQTPGSK